MTKNHANRKVLDRLFFVENDNTVTIENGLVDFSSYERKVRLSEIIGIFQNFPLVHEKEFEDFRAFKNNSIEFTV